MLKIIKSVRQKLTSIIWSFAFTGVVLLFLGVLVLVNGFFAQIVMFSVIVLVAVNFLLLSGKFLEIRQELDKWFKA
ncbi:MAG: hypothetical protein WCK11_02410 [Candidatus Falkowbacteria bacterium]